MPVSHHQLRGSKFRVGAVAAAMLCLAGVGANAGAATTAPRAKFGAWTALGVTTQTTTPAVWNGPGGRTWVLWLLQPSANHQNYEAAVISPSGSIVTKPYNIFGATYWGSLSGQPTMVGGGSAPTVIFDGQRSTSPSDPYARGCVVGATGSTIPWTMQTWSLSADCLNPVGGAAASKSGVLAAAWPGGWTTGHGVHYRVGTSPTIPAGGTDSDSEIALTGSAVASKVVVANDQVGNGHFYVVWVQVFSGSRDGYYAKDVTANSPVTKAPGSGTTSSNISPFAIPAVATPNTHAGVYAVFCSNSSNCALRLWRVGSTSVRAVPGSASAADSATSAGPAGRLWIAWYNESKNTVSIVRTNRADTAFGAVRTYGAPCFEHGLLGLSGGSSGRVTVALQCVNKALKIEDFFTQSIVGLTLTPSALSVVNTASHTITFKVTDVGDPVVGAHVSLGGKTVVTGATGLAKFVIAKGHPAGTIAVTASATNYLSATGHVSVLR